MFSIFSLLVFCTSTLLKLVAYTDFFIFACKMWRKIHFHNENGKTKELLFQFRQHKELFPFECGLGCSILLTTRTIESAYLYSYLTLLLVFSFYQLEKIESETYKTEEGKQKEELP